MSIPYPISVALESYTRPAHRPPASVKTGQIRVLATEGEDESRLALVLRVDTVKEVGEIMLIHAYPELATGSDLSVSSEQSTLPYTVVVETDCRGLVWLVQLGPMLGAIDAVALEAVGSVAVGRVPSGAGLLRGTRLRGRFDARWDFKSREGEALRALSADCTAAQLAALTAYQIDAGVLAPSLLASCADFERTALRLLELVKGNVAFDLRDAAALESVGALDVERWTEAFGFMGIALFESFWPLVERALSSGSEDARERSDPVETAWGAGRRREAGELVVRPDCRVISATYVREASHDASIELAAELDLELVDA